MSTVTLKNLHTSGDRLGALIRAGNAVRITENGETVAKLERVKPKSPRRSRKPRVAATQWLEANPPPGPGRPRFNAGEYLQQARAKEG